MTENAIPSPQNIFLFFEIFLKKRVSDFITSYCNKKLPQMREFF